MTEQDNIINAADFDITTHTRPPGGQNVGVSHGVTIKHLPTGITAIVPCERSQHRNRKIAMEMIEAALTSPDLKQ